MASSNSRAPMIIFPGNSHPELANLIVDKLGTKLGAVQAFRATGKGISKVSLSSVESVVDIGESVRGKNVYIIQTGTKDINNDIMEMLIMAYACRTSCSRKIVGVIPYMPYCKQSKMRKRGSIVSKLLASMICRAGFTHIITMDLHQKEIQGFFDCPVDNLRASPFLLEYIIQSIPDYRNAVIVARHPGAVKRATSYAERLRLSIAVIHGEEKVADSDRDDGRHSPPPPDVESRNGLAVGMELLPKLQPKEKPPINVVGDVGGKVAIVVDDMIDCVEAFVSVAQTLKEAGACQIYIMATHGLLSADAPNLIQNSPIDEVVVTNTVPHDLQKLQCSKIKTVDISMMLSEAIRRINNQESMSHLFQNISSED